MSTKLIASLTVCLVTAATPLGATQINPPAPGQQLPDIFSSCSGCTLVVARPPQTVLSSSGSWQATLVTAVFLDPNPIPGIRAGAGLDFFYQLTNISPCPACTSGPDHIERFTVTDFSPAGSGIPGLLVDIGFNLGSIPGFNPIGTAAPGLVDRVPPGNSIGWDFINPQSVALIPGSTSVILEIATNATHIKPGKASAIDGGTANFNAIAPSATDMPIFSKDDCKDGGWENFTTAPGPFKNQGACVSYFATNKD